MSSLPAETISESLDRCHVCGGREFEHTPVLWSDLIATWELSEEEANYIDVQQGTHCLSCGSNVRSIALARAIVRLLAFEGPLTKFVTDPAQHHLRVLEINEAGTLHPILRLLPRHQLASYPEVDMTSLPYSSGSFDLVVHSDTLEHVHHPQKGLEECRRVLNDRGTLIFTVPIVIGRLGRSRSGLPSSYHGHEGCRDPGMQVQSEFGADIWTLVVRAGFSNCELWPFRFPAGLAILARR